MNLDGGTLPRMTRLHRVEYVTQTSCGFIQRRQARGRGDTDHSDYHLIQ